jgi:DNA-binding PadR family transcriptional regulator
MEARFDVKLRHGALYPLLNEMERQELLTSQKQQQGGRTRKVYSITKKGKEHVDTYEDILKEQLDRSDIK